ncbi:hypothetical protein AMELA_G00017610 [Ameiurus melas]|uniref:Uncharacterized protein n=1 Tax=Ameiurus melas TaxID=219545 RepID=A0A7J6BAT3_AMEME|nr:hypothetical protein AMELA_G00017610 [Ameiurus melas]
MGSNPIGRPEEDLHISPPASMLPKEKRSSGTAPPTGHSRRVLANETGSVTPKEGEDSRPAGGDPHTPGELAGELWLGAERGRPTEALLGPGAAD